MKIQEAYTIIEDHLPKGDKKSETKIYEQLLGALRNVQARDMSAQQLESVEESLDRLEVHKLDGLKVREIKRCSNRFMKAVRETLSLVPEGHYMALGLSFGVAFGAVIGSIMPGIAGIAQGTSETGLSVGIGLIIGYIIGSYLDIEAKKQNRVLETRTR